MEKSYPLLTHLLELRRRLLWCVLFFLGALGVCYYFAAPIYAFLVKPLSHAMQQNGATDNLGGRRLIYTGLAEAFVTYLKIAFFAGGLLTIPMVLVQTWRFVTPALFAHEKKGLWPFFVATPVLFVAGAASAYFGIIPIAWQFFLSFENPSPVGGLPLVLEARVGEYLSLTMTMIVAFGLAYQLPVVLALLARVGVVNAAQLKALRKYALVIILIIAAILTPPDVISQTGLAVPLYALYEISIFVVALMEKKRNLEVKQDA
jgi:sec-independent protein translocase protein TatC